MSPDLIAADPVVADILARPENIWLRGLSAEEVAMLILDNCHQWHIDGCGSFFPVSKAIEEASEFEGLVAYRVKLGLKQARKQSPRVAMPTISESTTYAALRRPRAATGAAA